MRSWTRSSPPRGRFLRDVFVCSLGAYGGPESHFGVFVSRLVQRRAYLTEEELIELLALCTMLPGPTSTQTIVSVGYRMGGPVLALLTLLVWALPVLALMTGASFLYAWLDSRGLSGSVLRFIAPMAVGFIVYAAVRIGRKVVSDAMTCILFLAAGAVTYFVRDPWVFPIVLVAGGLVAIAVGREEGMWRAVSLRPPWIYLALFAVFALGAVVAASLTTERLVQLFESFYRYGYLVFGGGQVVVPVMQSELVDVRNYITNQEFLAGYGLVQGLPGPMFSFAAYAGGMAAREAGPAYQLFAAVIGGVGIFLPGLLLIYFVYPVWGGVRTIRAVRIALRGVNAVAGGLIAVSAVILAQAAGLTVLTPAIAGATALILMFTKIPAPLLVAAALLAGVLIGAT
ncbi:MAG: chromate efflux transporter [bacterium]